MPSFCKFYKNANYSMWLGTDSKLSFDSYILSMDTEDSVLKKFGDQVRELRKQQGISQEDLAFKANLHRTYIGMIERAEKNITLINIEKIAKALNVTIATLFS